MEIAQAVLDFLEKAATAAMTVGFPIAVRFAFIDGLVKVISGFVYSVGVGFFAFNIVKLAKRSQEEGDTNEIMTKLTIYSFLGFASFGLLITSEFFTGIKMMVAPEWFAILNLIELVKGG